MDKHNIKRLVIVLTLALGLGEVKAQQNIQFTQYIFNSLSVNPAYAGYKEEWFAQMALRSQWTGIDGAPKTGQASIDGVLGMNKNTGVGLQVTADKLGAQSATSVYANYAYRLRLDAEDTQRLSFGIGAGITQYGLDGNELRTTYPGDPTIPPGKISNTIPDIRFGVYYYNPRWYLGVSMMDLLSGDQSNNIFRWDANATSNLKRKRHMYLIGGALFDLSEDMKLRPSVMVMEDFKGPTNVDLNAMFIFGERVWLGAGYRMGLKMGKSYANGQQNLRSSNAITGVAQFYVTERLRIGYSYDHILSRLSSVQNGTHEVTIGLTFPQSGYRLISPRFF
ncbi:MULTISPECIES: PorP/SprF family type IX secretion system membrane protein [Olivibacter]|jgi:type IX secretion system PorP/SprF family membrane protein|uniref:Type IX secretion system membrane protein PorP/SprF n=2 Tax=Sphingobacteriaceae TaxID=84566 RepID=A0ABV6HH30_9SPHI|nr:MULTISPECIES: type IX secretion system membrane protein PorP/SprF [Olivibacter]MCL4637928.1 type IX secretion system membrane protein PorP/SprF [Olivibacter sp. UJ_SKK_5.1]MDM8176821.1 type IX secretion system membrane protein PorP/SprF [Olivibacter sp. 47]MDX3912935.1 type IX secretion system membrane protein PorP/SprF [Pseudosphingobacterium sp.]QEL00628.1 type IX secretion system membrane protein PorP/SprF [Olivibacter sp. LS-1]